MRGGLNHADVGVDFLILLVLLVAVLVLVTYLALWPVSTDPEAWTAPEVPRLEGAYAANQRLASVERIPVPGRGPEDVSFDAKGRMYVGLADGRIVRVPPDGKHPEDIAHTAGRPLGHDFDASGNLIVADAYKGLLSVSPKGEVQVLTTGHGGRPFRFTDDVDVGADGLYYFSDASSKFDLADLILDILEHRPNGRLLTYDPTTGETRLLLDRLYFANGVAVAPDDSFVLVVETNMYRVRRLWLKGPRAGQDEVFIDNLPGYPDNITSERGLFWLALFSPRDARVDSWAGRPFFRKVAAWLPSFLRPAAKHHAFVLGLDGGGRVVYNLQDASPGAFAPITSVNERGGSLYLGSVEQPAVARLPVP
jgi:sugar lactone lactonase YvrE